MVKTRKRNPPGSRKLQARRLRNPPKNPKQLRKSHARAEQKLDCKSKKICPPHFRRFVERAGCPDPRSLKKSGTTFVSMSCKTPKTNGKYFATQNWQKSWATMR